MIFRYRLILAFFLVNVLTLAFFYFWTTKQLESFLIENAAAQLEEELTILSRTCRLSDPELDSFVDLLASEGTFRITVIDSNGTVVADSAFSGQALREMENHADRPEMLAARRDGIGRSLRYSKMTSQNLLYVAMPLPGQEGIVRIAKRPADIEVLSEQLRNALGLGVLVLLLVGGLAVWATGIRMTRSIELLAAAAREITGGNFVRHIDVDSSDEVGALARQMEAMSDQLQKQVQLLQSEKEHLAAVLNGMSEGVLVVDRSSRIVTANPSFLTLFELREAPRGKILIEVIRNEDLAAAVEAALEGKGVETLEFDSRDQVITARFSPIGDREAVAGLVIVFHDVTELRRLEDLRKEFISNISHELKTPLTSIKGFSETLLDEEGFELRHRDFIRRIHQNSNQLSEMIDDLFSLARLETGDPRIEFGPVDFESLMTDLRAAFADLLNQKGLQLTWTNSAGSKTFIAGERYIRRVFENLIQNAIQYTDNGGIDIGFSDLGEELRFTVRDTGKGIPRQDLERVFERFYRVDKDRSRSTGGPGIGLAIVKHIVHLHGGRVWAESQLKCGTAIHFTLPRSSQSSD